jgi:hypothetical protein
MNKNLLDSFDKSKFFCEECKKYCDIKSRFCFNEHPIKSRFCFNEHPPSNLCSSCVSKYVRKTVRKQVPRPPAGAKLPVYKK